MSRRFSTCRLLSCRCSIVLLLSIQMVGETDDGRVLEETTLAPLRCFNVSHEPQKLPKKKFYCTVLQKVSSSHLIPLYLSTLPFTVCFRLTGTYCSDGMASRYWKRAKLSKGLQQIVLFTWNALLNSTDQLKKTGSFLVRSKIWQFSFRGFAPYIFFVSV